MIEFIEPYMKDKGFSLHSHSSDKLHFCFTKLVNQFWIYCEIYINPENNSDISFEFVYVIETYKLSSGTHGSLFLEKHFDSSLGRFENLCLRIESIKKSW